MCVCVYIHTCRVCGFFFPLREAPAKINDEVNLCMSACKT